jgi:xanthine dehydrogenase accessory factor
LLLDLLNEIVRRAGAGEPLAVCTIVAARGSVPQRAGAVMLVLRDGRTLGTIGGGCVEAEVRTRALSILSATPFPSGARLMSFSLNHDLGWDDGLICGGAMDVAVEAIDSLATAKRFLEARDQLATGASATLTTVAPADDGRPVTFVHELLPAPRLIIAGAGHVALALSTVAQTLGFAVTVIDDRPDFANAQRFPGAACRVGHVEAELHGFPIDGNTYVAIVTRGHRNDAHALAAVVERPARYIGLIGSRRKIVAIFEELHRNGVPPESLAKVHAPIGLAIGAVTPAEIAVSVAAELVATRRGAPVPAGPMRLTPAQLQRIWRHQDQ